MKVLGKSCKPIPIMIFGVLFASKRYYWRKYLYVFMIVIGVVLFLYKDQPSKGTNRAVFEVGVGELFLVSFTLTALSYFVHFHLRVILMLFFFVFFFDSQKSSKIKRIETKF